MDWEIFCNLKQAPLYIPIICSDFDDEVESLQGLSADLVVEACVRCLEIIDPDFQSSKTLPEAMSARYRMCSTLANAIQVYTQENATRLFNNWAFHAIEFVEVK